MSLHANIIATLKNWRPQGEQEYLRQAYLGFLEAREDACYKPCVPGHITISTVVLDVAAQHTLLTLHSRLGEWLQLGGHCEPTDHTAVEVALREAHEESGITGIVIDPIPCHLAVHPLTCSLGVPTRHFDICFVAYAPSGAQPVQSHESDDLRWWPVNQLPAGAAADIPALVRTATNSSRLSSFNDRPR